MNILISVVVITSIAGALAVLLTLANSYIANFGECKINVNEDKKEFVVEGGSSLLSALRDEQIFIPSACGGKGSCSYCKVKVIEGGGPILATELPYLSKEEQSDNIRLSCQCKVKENMKIEIPEHLFNVKEFSAVVEDITDLSPTIKQLKLNLVEPTNIVFKAGQYIQLRAPQYEGNSEEVYRAYSLASSMNMNGSIDLIIGYVPNGICTTYVHKFLKKNNEVLFNGPYGDFFLNKESSDDILLIAVGTGMAPMRSILYQLKESSIDRKIVYYFGARTLDDLILVDEMRDFEKIIPNFQFIPCLSRPRPEDNWSGEVGRVTDLIEKNIENGMSKEAYLCGSNTMIQSTIDMLKKKGVEDGKIYYDKFD